MCGKSFVLFCHRTYPRVTICGLYYAHFRITVGSRSNEVMSDAKNSSLYPIFDTSVFVISRFAVREQYIGERALKKRADESVPSRVLWRLYWCRWSLNIVIKSYELIAWSLTKWSNNFQKLFFSNGSESRENLVEVLEMVILWLTPISIYVTQPATSALSNKTPYTVWSFFNWNNFFI